jgi:hypothetical protein
MIRRTSTALAAALIGTMVLLGNAHAQTIVCQVGQKTCGSRCYSPLKGESCNEGNIVCQVGQKVCGTRCYSPLKGESCNIRTK